MGRKKLTPAIKPVPMNTITFSSTRIAEFGRDGETKGWIKFHSSMERYSEELFSKLGWEIPEEHCSLKRFDAVFRGGNLILSSRGKLIDADVDIEFKELKSFECHRVDKGKKKRRELRFFATFDCEDGAANLESYMIRTDNARGSLRVQYVKDPKQTKIEGRQLEIA